MPSSDERPLKISPFSALIIARAKLPQVTEDINFRPCSSAARPLLRGASCWKPGARSPLVPVRSACQPARTFLVLERPPLHLPKQPSGQRCRREEKQYNKQLQYSTVPPPRPDSMAVRAKTHCTTVLLACVPRQDLDPRLASYHTVGSEVLSRCGRQTNQSYGRPAQLQKPVQAHMFSFEKRYSLFIFCLTFESVRASCAAVIGGSLCPVLVQSQPQIS